MLKAITAALVMALLLAAGVYAATVVTELHPYQETVTVRNKNQVSVFTVRGTITDLDTIPDPQTVTVRETVTVTTQDTTAPPTTTTAPTTTTEPPPPPPPADYYVSPTGSDAGSCSQSLPCQSFARAASVALSGSTIRVLPGTYGVQKFAGGYGSTQGDVNKTLTWVGSVGNAVRQINFGSGNFTFDGVNVNNSGGSRLTGAGLENGGAPFTFKNAEIGNITDEKGALVTGSGIVFDNVRFHDVRIATAGVHLECIFAAVSEGMVVRNSRFENCDVMDIFFVWPDWWSPAPPAYGNVVLEDNYFGDPGGSCCGIYIGGTGPSGDRTMRNWTVRRNFFGDGPAIAGASGGIFCGNTGAAPANWQVACS